MSDQSYDLVIIGHGVAGCAAAAVAREAGIDFCVLTHGPGQSALSSGLFSGAPVPHLDLLPALLSTPPTHREELWPELLEHRQRPALLADVIGRLFVCYAAPPWHLKGDLAPFLQSNRESQVGLIQFEHPLLTPDPAASYQRSLGKDVFVEVTLPLPPHIASPFELARRCDDGDLDGLWLPALREFVEARELGLLLFPPVLGHHPNTEAWEDELGVPCAELLATTPSLPGYRLMSYLATQTPELLQGEVVGHFSQTQVQKLEWRPAGGASPSWIEAKRVLLATGLWVGKGASRTLKAPPQESIFGLPLFTSRGVLDDIAWQQLQRSGAKEIFSAGIRLDPELRPLDPHGQVAHPNLHAAGGITGTCEAAACVKQAQRAAAAAIEALDRGAS